MKTKSNNFKYFLTAKYDELIDFIKCNKLKLIVFSLFLVLGLVIGILSALKPVDPCDAFVSHNGALCALIEHADFLQFILASLFFSFILLVVTSVFCGFSYSFLLLFLLTLVLGYFQGGSVVFIIRIYGVIAIPFVIIYVFTTLLTNFILFAHFALAWKISYEKRKYGCSPKVTKTLLSALLVFAVFAITFFIKLFLLILFSFFL